MSFFAALLVVLSIFGSPTFLVLYGVILGVIALVMFAVAGPAAEATGFYEDFTLWEIIVWWFVFIILTFTSITLFVMVFG